MKGLLCLVCPMVIAACVSRLPATPPPQVSALAPVVHPTPQPPRIHADGTVIFTYAEPNAKEVELNLDGMVKPKPMLRGNDGAWSVTVGPLKPENYHYSYRVDGEDVLDPASHAPVPNLIYHASMLRIPGAAVGGQPQLWEHTNVPHGAVEERFFHSEVVGDERDLYVYTPPGYDPRAAAKYPVLYLQHGYSDDASAWTVVGSANFILDNLIALGKARPMIVVMPLGYGAPSILTNRGQLDDAAMRASNYRIYAASLLGEVMPWVERELRVLTGPENTAIAGLSMGGAEALYAGVQHPEKFGYVAAMSTAHVSFDDPAQGWQWKAKRELLWLSCGVDDRVVGDENRALYGWLKQQGVDATLSWTPGGHEWEVWHDNLITIAPKLFR